jgi:hypothetical protein
MPKTRVEVLAQYIDEDGRKKGGQQFFFFVKDADIFLYAPKKLVEETIQTMLDNHHKGSYVYVEHKLVFFEPIELTDDFGVIAQRIHDAAPEDEEEVYHCDSCDYTTTDEMEIYDGGMCCIECKSDPDHDGQSGYFRN